MTIQQPPEGISLTPRAHSAAAAGALPRILPFAAYIAFIVAADLLERGGVAAATLRWLYPLKIAAVLLLLLSLHRHYHELRKLPSPAEALAATGLGTAVFALWITLGAGWMQIGQARGFDPSGAAGALDWRLAAPRIAGAVLVVPLMEELFWRSFLLRWLQQRNFLSLPPSAVRGKACLITIVLFGIEHHLWLAGMVAGAAYTLLYVRSETLWTPILGHAVTNGLLAVWVMATASWNYW